MEETCSNEHVDLEDKTDMPIATQKSKKGRKSRRKRQNSSETESDLLELYEENNLEQIDISNKSTYDLQIHTNIEKRPTHCCSCK